MIRLRKSATRRSLGSIWLGLRRKYGKGLRVAYYRDVVRPRILETAPISNLNDDRCELHALVSQDDWLNLVWALKSFYWTSGRRYRLCIHDDGSLDPTAAAQLRRHFSAARLIDRARADAEMPSALVQFPLCQAFRESNHFAPKILDFRHYLHSERMLLLDSDVLFFRQPTELLRRIEDPNYERNSVNEDVAAAYTVNADDVRQRFGFELPERFNSGLGLIHAASIRLDRIEEFLALPGILSHFWRIEQTLYALCSARHGTELLPPEYRIALKGSRGNCVARHYVGAVRHLMYGEGMAHLARKGLLRSAAAATSAKRRAFRLAGAKE